jgi:hypothetical protein
MPDQIGRENPAGNPNGELPSQAAAIAAIEKRVEALESQPNTRSEISETENLERDIKKGEFWLILVNALLLVAQIIIACIYYGQLKEMRQATSAATQASLTAKDTLTEMRTGGGAQDTHTLAQQAVAQATQTTELANASKAQLLAFERTQGAILRIRTVTEQIQKSTDPPHKVTFFVKNVGHGAALNISMQRGAPIIGLDSWNPGTDSLEKLLQPIPVNKNGPALGEGEEDAPPIELKFESFTQLVDAKRRGQTEVVYLNISYQDVFGNVGHTSGCVFSQYAMGFITFTPCPGTENQTHKHTK